MNEKRSFKRYTLNLPISIRDSSSVICCESSVQDISVGGLRIETSLPVKKGDVVDCVLKVPTAAFEFAFRGRIKWVSDTSSVDSDSVLFGAQFEVINPADKFNVLQFAYKNNVTAK